MLASRVERSSRIERKRLDLTKDVFVASWARCFCGLGAQRNTLLLTPRAGPDIVGAWPPDTCSSASTNARLANRRAGGAVVTR